MNENTMNQQPMPADSELLPDDFERFLRQQLQQSQPYLMDDNFSAGVMAKLPAPRPLSRWQERLILLLPLAIITLLVLSQFSLLSDALKTWYWLLALDAVSLMQLGVMLVVTVISAACYWIAKQVRLI